MIHGLGLALPTFVLAYPAVTLVALLNGLWPGILATALAAVGIDFLILAPARHFVSATVRDAVSLVVFSAMGLLMSLVAERFRLRQHSLGERKGAQALHQREALYSGLFNSMDEGFCRIEMIFDPEGKPCDFRFLEVNPSFERQTGLQDAVGKRIRELVPLVESRWIEVCGLVASSGEPAHFLDEFKALRRHFKGSAYRVEKPELHRVAVVLSDTTANKEAEDRIRRLNRVLAVLSDINQTIFREKDPQAMMAAACRIAVDKGKFRMVWIGMADPATHVLEPIAAAGLVNGYLDEVNISLLEPSAAPGPAARCFHSGRHAICNDIEHDPLYEPWRGKAMQCGYRSSAGFPLRCEGKIVGVFSIYANELGFFDEDEIRLLDEMAIDISFALDVYLHEAERRKVEEELRWQKAFFEAQAEATQDGVLVVDHQGRVVLQNRRVTELWKMPAEVALDPDDAKHLEFVKTAAKNPEEFIEKIEYLNSHPDEVGQDEIELLDGTVLDRYSSPVKDRAGRFYGRIWVFHDRTMRRQNAGAPSPSLLSSLKEGWICCSAVWVVRLFW